MDQKASKDLAPRELLGNVYTAHKKMETWHLPRELGYVDYCRKKEQVYG